MPRSAPDALLRFTARGLGALDVPDADAALVAESLVEAGLEGQASHGLLRLPFLLDRLRSGLINPRPEFRVSAQRAAAVVLDAGNGLGPGAGVRAAGPRRERARAAGAPRGAGSGRTHPRVPARLQLAGR